MANTATADNLRDNLCRTFCSYYKPEKIEEVTCLGYHAVSWLLNRGMHMDFIRGDNLLSPASEDILSGHLCPECPFYEHDCDYAEKKEKALPCGGFILLTQLLTHKTISIDDIRNFGLHLGMTITVYDLAEKARKKGEYILGAEELQTHACYLGFGILGPGEKNREIKPGSGHEEICCIVSGTVTLCLGAESFLVRPGQAFHLKGEQTCFINNEGTSEAVYVLAGGHSNHYEHH